MLKLEKNKKELKQSRKKFNVKKEGRIFIWTNKSQKEVVS
jgi:hypothetical protein